MLYHGFILFLCPVMQTMALFFGSTNGGDEWSVEEIPAGVSGPSARTLNIEAKYVRWPKRNRIPFAVDPRYTPVENALIKAAMNQIMADLNYWITFVPVPVGSKEYKIFITPFRPDNMTPESVCYSFPGMLVIAPRLEAMGIKEQRLVLARGPNGCLDGTVHSIMKHIVVVLGKRNEHQRADREAFIQLNSSHLTPLGKAAYRVYSKSEANWLPFAYDYCSITHNQPADFALTNTTAFTVLQPPFFIPKLNRLSETDCRLLLLLYGGDPAACTSLNCSLLRGATNHPISPTPTISLTVASTNQTTVPSSSPGTIMSTSSISAAATFTSTINTTSTVATTASTTSASTTVTSSPVTTTASTTQITTIPTTTAVPTPKPTLATTALLITITKAATSTTPAVPVLTNLAESIVMLLKSNAATEIGCPENFCKETVDHVAMYLDGMTSLLISGECAQKVDSAFRLVGPVMTVTEAFPDGVVVGPIQAVWTDLNELGQYRMHVVDKNGLQRFCTMSGCNREERPSFADPSLFAIQMGQSQTFRRFKLNGTGIIDMMEPNEPISLSWATAHKTESVFSQLIAAWMFYRGPQNSNTVAVIGVDQDANQLLAELTVDLTQTPAVFTHKPDVPIMSLASKLHPCH